MLINSYLIMVVLLMMFFVVIDHFEPIFLDIVLVIPQNYFCLNLIFINLEDE